MVIKILLKILSYSLSEYHTIHSILPKEMIMLPSDVSSEILFLINVINGKEYVNDKMCVF